MIALLPLSFVALFFTLKDDGWRDRYLKTATYFGVAIVLLTEGVGATGYLTRGVLAVVWSVLLIVLLLRARKHFHAGSCDP